MKMANLVAGRVYRITTRHQGVLPAVALEAGLRVALDPVDSREGRTVQYVPRTGLVDATMPAGYRRRLGCAPGVPMLVGSWSSLGGPSADDLRDLERAGAAFLTSGRLRDPLIGSVARSVIDVTMVDAKLARLASVNLVALRNVLEEWPRDVEPTVDLDERCRCGVRRGTEHMRNCPDRCQDCTGDPDGPRRCRCAVHGGRLWIVETAWLLPGECIVEGCLFVGSRHQHKRPARPGEPGAGPNWRHTLHTGRRAEG